MFLYPPPTMYLPYYPQLLLLLPSIMTPPLWAAGMVVHLLTANNNNNIYTTTTTHQKAVVGVADYSPLDYTSCFFRDTTVEIPTFKWDEATQTNNRKKGVFEKWESKTHRKVRWRG